MRTLGPGASLRTRQSDAKWLSEPTFVSSFQDSGFVYVVFTENAVETLDCGKVRRLSLLLLSQCHNILIVFFVSERSKKNSTHHNIT